MYHMDIVNSKRIKNSMLGLFIMMAKIKNKIKTMVCICVCMGGGVIVWDLYKIFVACKVSSTTKATANEARDTDDTLN